MQMPESFREYTELVCRQLRWKKARPVIEREIGAHLCDQRDAFMKSGMEENDATREALRQMGDAVAVGTALDRVHRPKPAWALIALTALLALIGMSIRLILTYDSDAPWKPILNLAAVLLGTGCMLGAYFLDFTLIGKRPLVFYFGAVLAIAFFYLIPGQLTANGRYIYAQNVLLLFPLAFAALLYRLRGRKYAGLILAFLGAALLSLGCLFVPSAAELAVTVISVLLLMIAAAAGDWFSIGRARTFIFIGAVVIAAAVIFLLTVPADSRLAARVAAAFNPWSERKGPGYIGVVVRELIGGARFIGRGATGESSVYARI